MIIVTKYIPVVNKHVLQVEYIHFIHQSKRSNFTDYTY